VVTLPPMEVASRIAKLGSTLTVAERRVAQVVLDRPQLVAFGTVAELASVSDAGAATVVRLASKLQFDGFSALQASVQHDLAVQLRPAAERIREPAADDLIGRHLELEMTNIQSSLRAIDADALDDVVGHLVDGGSRVLVLSGDATRGVASQLAGDLGALRDDVSMLEGTDIAVKRQLALLRPTDVLIALDLRRYERWVVEAATRAHAAGVWSVAITDSLLSPLAERAERTFVVSAAGAGPFDSHVGTLAICNVLVAAVADRMRAAATERLDRLEAEWQQSFTDR
jgi:DNA-binding MurR/RpiR family transcriptional regulator